MRGTLAKAIRGRVYGESGTGRTRKWSSTTAPTGRRHKVTDHLKRVIGETVRIWWRGKVTADPQRRVYQQSKALRRGLSWRNVWQLS